VHYVVEQKHRGVWKRIARRPTSTAAVAAVREIRRDVKPAPPLRIRKVPG
jgi:hypothetical protein